MAMESSFPCGHPDNRLLLLLPDWTIRSAGEEDIASVLDLWAAAGSPPSVSDSPDGLARLLGADPQALLVAELDGVLVGSLIAAWDGWRGSFYRLAVSPEHRRPSDAGYCHCTRCQRRTGTASSVQARIDGRTLRLLAGEDLVKAWRHPEGGFEKLFCRECGGHLFSRNPEDHRQMSVRLGAFDGDPGVRPCWRAFVAYAVDWEPIPDDGLERFAEAKPQR